MLTFTKRMLFWWPVKVRLPDPAFAGKFKEGSFDVQFAFLTFEAAKEFDDAQAARSDIEQTEHRFDHIKAVIADWRGLVDEQKAPVPCSPDAIASIVQIPWYRDGIWAAYVEALNGREPVALGN